MFINWFKLFCLKHFCSWARYTPCISGLWWRHCHSSSCFLDWASDVLLPWERESLCQEDGKGAAVMRIKWLWCPRYKQWKFDLSTSLWDRVLKPRPNDRNISTQHIATLLDQHVARVWPPCCDVLWHVGCCWLKFECGQIFHATFVDVAWCCTRLAGLHPVCVLVRFSTPNMSQHAVSG